MGKDYLTAIDYFNKAVKEDPNYALAYAGLGDTYFLKIWISSSREEIKENREKAEYFALKALEIDPNLVEAHTVLATLYFYIDWNWEKANIAFKKAFDIGTKYSTLHHRFSEYLSYLGKHEEARSHINKAIELDPLSFIVREVSAKLYLNNGSFHKAIAESKIAEDLNKESIRPSLYQFWSHYMLKNDSLAIENIKKLRTVIKNNTTNQALESIYEVSGTDGLMRWYISKISDPHSKAKSLFLLGDINEGINILEDAFNKGRPLGDIPYMYPSHILHSNQRFMALMKKMNLPYSTVSNK